jgi:hypothetical protein
VPSHTTDSGHSITITPRAPEPTEEELRAARVKKMTDALMQPGRRMGGLGETVPIAEMQRLIGKSDDELERSRVGDFRNHMLQELRRNAVKGT